MPAQHFRHLDTGFWKFSDSKQPVANEVGMRLNPGLEIAVSQYSSGSCTANRESLVRGVQFGADCTLPLPLPLPNGNGPVQVRDRVR